MISWKIPTEKDGARKSIAFSCRLCLWLNSVVYGMNQLTLWLAGTILYWFDDFPRHRPALFLVGQAWTFKPATTSWFKKGFSMVDHQCFYLLPFTKSVISTLDEQFSTIFSLYRWFHHQHLPFNRDFPHIFPCFPIHFDSGDGDFFPCWLSQKIIGAFQVLASMPGLPLAPLPTKQVGLKGNDSADLPISHTMYHTIYLYHILYTIRYIIIMLYHTVWYSTPTTTTTPHGNWGPSTTKRWLSLRAAVSKDSAAKWRICWSKLEM